jgi:hypothetical protein
MMRSTGKRTRTLRKAARTQRDVLCDVMLSAAQCETWLTLQELSLLTHYGEASISAQLRHLRKREFGGFVVEKRQRDMDAVVRKEIGVVWEYQLRRGVRRKFMRRRLPCRGRGLAVEQSC